MADALDMLRRHLVVRSAYDAMVVVKSAGRSLPPGTNLVVFLAPSGRFVDQWTVENSDDALEFVVASTCELVAGDATAAFIVSVRPGVVPEVAPGEEERWCALAEIAEDAGIDLLDWLVVAGTVVLSVAEHAAVPPGWPSTREALETHPELRYDPTRSRPAAHRPGRRRRKH